MDFKKYLNSFKVILLWILTGIFVLLALIFGVGGGGIVAALLMLIAAALIAPLPLLQSVKKKIKHGSKIAALVAAVLFVAAAGTLAPADVEEPASTNVEQPAQVTPSEIPVQTNTPVPTLEPTPNPAPAPTTEPTPEPTTQPTPEPALENSTFSIRFIDVGQADAALVECDGHYMLIDGGNKSDSSKIYSILKQTAVEKLDIVVATHAHEDHIGGIPGAYNYTTADITLCPTTSYDSEAFEDFVKYADKNGGGITVPSVGDKYSLGSSTVTILGVNGGSEINDTSIILKVLYGSTSFLFTGDAERGAEQAVLSSGADLSATVLKVGHHGSDGSTTYPFLREIMPQYAIISVGKDNSYGHPNDNTLSRLRDADVVVYRTDINGDICATSDGKSVSISVVKQAVVTPEPTPTPIPTPTPTSELTPTPAPISTPTPTTEPTATPNYHNYVINTNTGKFHETWCSSAADIKPHNRWDYQGTRDDVINMGYEACKRCNP